MYKVLLVDDEILAREAIEKRISWEEAGFSFAGSCENGRDAIRFLEKTPVDLVITDIYMPYIDGIGVCKYLQANFPDTMAVVYSGYNDFEYARQALRYGAAEYLLKPVTARDLTEMLARVRRKLDESRSNRTRMEQLVKAQRAYAKNRTQIYARAMSDLVRGTKPAEESRRELSEMGTDIAGRMFRVGIVDIDVYSPFFAADEETRRERTLMEFAAANICGEMMETAGAGYSWLDADRRVYLLFVFSELQTNREEEIGLAQDIQKNISGVLGLTVSVSLGTRVSTAEQLHLSAEAAEQALEYRFTRGAEFLYDAQEKPPKADFAELEIDYRDITLAIRRGDRTLLKDAFAHILHWMQNAYLNRTRAQVALNRLVRVIAEAAGEAALEETAKEAQVSTEEMLLRVLGQRNVQDSLKLAEEYACSRLAAVETGKQGDKDRQVQLAMRYLQENFKNPKLSLADVCAHLNTSSSRFSRIFKEGTGETFTEALMDIRMENARRLLTETSLKYYEIAEKVGFNDPHYFSTVFRKVHGVTPREYAKMHTKETE